MGPADLAAAGAKVSSGQKQRSTAASVPTDLVGQAALRNDVSFGRRSQWERIALGPNVELQVRRPLSRVENRALEQLLEAARALFEGEPEGES